MAELFNITHDANNLNEYDSTVTDGGDLSTGTPGLAGTTAKMELLVDDTATAYGQKNFTVITSREWRLRCYIDPNGITLPGYNHFLFCLVYHGGILTEIHIENRGDVYTIRARQQDDNWASRATGYYTITDAPHYVEVYVKHATSSSANNGILTLWIDGVQKQTITDLDLYDRGQPELVQLGAPFGAPADTSGTLYLDEFVFRDDGTEIGPVAAAGQPAILRTQFVPTGAGTRNRPGGWN